MNTITSRQNPEIIAVSELGHAKARTNQGLFIAEGSRACATLIASSIKLAQLYVTENMLEKAKKHTNERKITLVNESVMEKIAHTTTPSGMVGVFHIPQQPSLDTLG